MVQGSEVPIKDFKQLAFISEDSNEVQGNRIRDMDNEIDKLLDMKVTEKCNHETGEIISPIILVKKPDGTFRMILNLKQFNQTVQYEHFKMENLTLATEMMTQHCYMASVDLRHAYYSVPVKPDFRKFLRFKWKDQLYQYTCFANGLCNCPRYFTKLMKPVYSALHSQGYICSFY